MTIAAIPPPTNLFLLPTVPLPQSVMGEMTALRPEQVIQALVVKGGTEEPLLEIAGERFRILGQQRLQPGSVLDLRILQVSPRLEAQVLVSRLEERVAGRLPGLLRPLDWSTLLQTLEQSPKISDLSPEQRAAVQQLRQILDPSADRFDAVRDRMNVLARELRFIEPAMVGNKTLTPLVDPASERTVTVPAPVAATVPAAQVRQAVELLVALRQQLTSFVEEDGRGMSRHWQRTTAELLARIDVAATPALRAPEWQQTLNLLRHHPGVTRQIADLAAAIGQRLESLPAGGPRAALSVPENVPSAAPTFSRSLPAETMSTAQPVSLPGLPVPAAGTPSLQATAGQDRLSAPTNLLLRELAVLLESSPVGPKAAPTGLPPELLGRAEALADKIYLAFAGGGLSTLQQQGLQLVAIELRQLLDIPPVPPRGQDLGILSQLFGLHLERELVLDKQKKALANLKQSLLQLQQKAGEELKEPLSRIELYQLIKARFAETQLQFLPLPFVGLEDGYLLAGPRRDGGQESAESHQQAEHQQISLSLRLSALGNMRVDLSYDAGRGLAVRIACEDQTRMDYLKQFADELSTTVAGVKLNQVHFSADARYPVQQLQQALLPQRTTLLDTRI